jgi:hypothetical protein
MDDYCVSEEYYDIESNIVAIGIYPEFDERFKIDRTCVVDDIHNPDIDIFRVFIDTSIKNVIEKEIVANSYIMAAKYGKGALWSLTQ